jgi:hypothetical protein
MLQRDPAESRVTLQENVQRFQLLQSLQERTALSPLHEPSETLAQLPRPIGNGVQFGGSASARMAFSAAMGASRACSSQSSKSSPSSIQSMVVSIGVAIEFGKSKAGASPTKIAGLRPSTDPRTRR